jgi:glycosyltransferase involved in cell wall biosynthesis
MSATSYAPAPRVSVIILTYNEQQNIADCLASCAWCNDVHVLDSGSTDRTCAIASELGAHVHHNRFESFGQQRNWAIDHIPTKHAWHFHLDADERFTPALVREILSEIGPDAARTSAAAYLVPSKMIFLGKWLKFSGGYPAYQVRLFNASRCKFVDFGHGQREKCNGPVMRLVQPYIHHNFSKGLLDWLAKHNHYSDQESREAIAIRAMRRPTFRDLRDHDPIVRRRALKNLSYRMKGRGFLRFIDMFVRRGGWLDGTAGIHYSTMMSMYEYWTELKIREKEAGWRAATDALATRMLRGESS